MLVGIDHCSFLHADPETGASESPARTNVLQEGEIRVAGAEYVVGDESLEISGHQLPGFSGCRCNSGGASISRSLRCVREFAESNGNVTVIIDALAK